MFDIVLELHLDSCAVYVFVGEHIALVDFVYCLQRLHLLDKGEYIIISVDDEIYDPDHRLNIVQRGKCSFEKLALWKYYFLKIRLNYILTFWLQ